jgi:uncharacterized repeat protein (TIGR01451 family)
MSRKKLAPARIMILAIAIIGSVTADAARGRRASIDEFPPGWEKETPCNFQLPQPGENCGPVILPGTMLLKIGTKFYNSVWINQNGFISLGETVNESPALYLPGATDLVALDGNIIAPFYAPIHLRDVEQGCPDNNEPRGCIWDLTYSTLTADPDEDPDNPPEYLYGFRATWGLFPIDPNPPEDPTRLPGVSRTGDDDPQPARNTIQAWFIDRSTPTGGSGDFDLNLNYSGIQWQTPTTLVGVKTGSGASPEVLVDFSKFYTSFLDDNPAISPDNIAFCSASAQDNPRDPPRFEKSFPFGCNRITIEFRNGIPKLKTYTSDMSGSLTAAAGTHHAAVPYSMTLTVSNGDDDAATNALATIDLPAGATLASTPASACNQAGTVAICRIGAVPVRSSATLPVTISSNQSGRHNFTVQFDADQYDWQTSNNRVTPFVDVADSADLSITACNRPASVTQGDAFTVTCTVRNDGPQAAQSVVLETPLPSVLSFTSGTGCAVASGTLTCTHASLAPNATHDFGITFGTPAAGAATLAMTTRSLVTFDQQANNTRDASLVVNSSSSSSSSSGGSSSSSSGGGGRLSLDLVLLLLLALALAMARRVRRAPAPARARPRQARTGA